MLYFDPTAVNFTTLIFIALAVWTASVVGAVRPQHNLPMIYWGLMWVFNSWFERDISEKLLLAGTILAMAIRFEFLNAFFTKWVSYLEVAAIVATIWACMVAIFGPALAIQL